jgi:hypothetical protein
VRENPKRSSQIEEKGEKDEVRYDELFDDDIVEKIDIIIPHMFMVPYRCINRRYLYSQNWLNVLYHHHMYNTVYI